MAMAAFAGQVITLFTIGLNLRIKQNALINEPLDARSGVAGDELNCMAIAQSRAGNQRILDVRIDTVGFIKNSGNASLGIECRAFTHRPFTQDNNPMFLSQAQSQ